ncbi:diaminopimelate dehydrogenase [Savagea sp. SN6]|uniref:Meso-diaminopimelate D-dehydrogenase n=1 Tax=Savagea serpentis TaxID=2785297 RepID=A0A8J7GCK8_9BACL|nr:diaminopimelate dehydrogenase [Savagea serpentis]MBF4501660.1 diaminopimelate dehydrogenase [Savagea serpentis]
MIQVGIVGYGNLGRGVEYAIQKTEDLELVGVFSRRAPETVETVYAETNVYALNTILDFKEKIDVLVLCGGSKDDLPQQTPELAEHFAVVDSFDTHANIPDHFAKVDEAAQKGKQVAIISTGWDPGLFSLNRIMMEAIIPDGKTDTFWGKGLSQGHSDAVRRVDGVKGGVQYTIPSEVAMEKARSGSKEELETKEKHVRECYVVLEEGADAKEVEQAIVTMPNYFEPYDTTVHFITEEELARDHQAMPHGGFVIRSGQTGEGTNQTMEFSLKLDSNPEFTSSVLVAYARAAARLAKEGVVGAQTPFDIAPKYIHPKTNEQLRKQYL